MVKVEPYIRWMIRRDMADVLMCEALTSKYERWEEKEFLHALRQRNTIGMVLEDVSRGRVVGFMVYELHKAKLHLLKLAVLPAYQNKGLGTAMVEKLKSKLHQHRRTHISTEVIETDEKRLFFFKKNGFLAHSIYPSEDDIYPEQLIFMFYKLDNVEKELGW